MREPDLLFNFCKLITQNKLVEINYYDEDAGPIMKLLTGIDFWSRNLYTAFNDKLIITVDDDTIYNKYLFETLIDEYKHGKHSVFCNIGRDCHSKKIYGTDTINRPLTSIEGYGGVMYDSKIFKSDFKRYTIGIPPYIRTNDDLLISYYLKTKNIHIKHVRSIIKEPFTTFFYTEATNPLWIINEKGKNFQNASELLDLFDKCM